MATLKKKIRAGVIGVGRMGQYHAGAYSELQNVDLVGVCDSSAERGKQVAQKFETKYFSDCGKLLKGVDVASIAVPTSHHYEVAKQALAAGVHVLLEKPVTNRLDHAEELFEIARKKGVVLQIGHVERFNGAVQELQKIVHEPILIESRRLAPYDPRIQDDGVVLDMMIHDIDIVLNLVDSEIVRMGVVGLSVYTEREDLANVQLQFKSGTVATITASRASQNKIRHMAVTQEDAYVFLDFSSQDIHIHRRAKSQVDRTKQELRYKQEALIEQIFVHKENPLKLELMHLIECATNGVQRRVSPEKELQSLRVALEVMESIRRQRGKPGRAGK